MGYRIVIKCNVVRYLSIFLKGLRSFVRQHSKRHRGTMILYFLLFFAKASHMHNMTIFKATKWSRPYRYKVCKCLYLMLGLSWIRVI